MDQRTETNCFYNGIFSAGYNFLHVKKALDILFLSPNIEYINLSYQLPSVVSEPASIGNFYEITRGACKISLPSSLKHLDISHNSANSIGFMYLGEFTLTTNSSLSFVHLSYTQLTHLQHSIKCKTAVEIHGGDHPHGQHNVLYTS